MNAGRERVVLPRLLVADLREIRWLESTPTARFCAARCSSPVIGSRLRQLRRSSGAAARNQSHWSARIWNSADLPRGESVGTPQILVQGSRRRAGVFLGRRSRLRWRRKIWNHSVACESRQYDGESRVGPRARTRAQHRRRHERHASRRRTGKAAVPIRAGCAHSHRLLSAKRAGRQMKPTTSTLLLLAVLALPFPCLADRVRQECRTAAAADSDVPGSVRGYMDRNPGAVLRVCKQLDLNTASYYARGPISKSGEICSFAQSRIEPERGEPSSTLQYMVRSKGPCPAYESARYVPAHNTTETDFAALAKFL